MRIRVVFLQDVPPRHLAGDVKLVTGGYARNYLIPRGLAAPAVAQHLQGIDKLKKVAEERRTRETKDMELLAQRINGLTVAIKARAGDEGRLYGSVTNTRIAEALSQALERPVDRRLVLLPEPIKELGTFQVSLRLYQNIAPTITLVVEAEGAAAEPAAVAEAGAPDQPHIEPSDAGSGGPEAEESDVRGEAPTP